MNQALIRRMRRVQNALDDITDRLDTPYCYEAWTAHKRQCDMDAALDGGDEKALRTAVRLAESRCARLERSLSGDA